MLFNFQEAIVQWAIKKRKAAVFADCGLGKTFIQLQWLHQLGGGLIVAPLAVAQQTGYEARKLGLETRYVRHQSEVGSAGIYIANYEMIEGFDPAQWRSVVLDESSILKSVDGSTRTYLIEHWGQVPHRLCCTATPAPNDITELGNHSEYLGVMPRSQMLATFFVHDDDGWRIKGHAQERFYEWLATWAIIFQRPSQIGFAQDGFDLPPLKTTANTVCLDPAKFAAQTGRLFATGLSGIEGRLTARRQSLALRVAKAIEIIAATPQQWLVWCGLNKEGRTLAQQLDSVALVEGSMPLGEKVRQIGRFLDGTAQVLVTKAKVAGFGMNFQHCRNVMFLGLSDSYEVYYQGIRRCWRYGQKNPVRVEVIMSDLEQVVLDNVLKKETQHQATIDAMAERASYYGAFALKGAEPPSKEYQQAFEEGEQWQAVLGDSTQELPQLASETVDFTVFSPPFLNLYSYTDDPRDLGNAPNDSQFLVGYEKIAAELLRVTKHGRLVAVHVAQVATKKVHDGFIGIKDFRGLIIKAMIDVGFHYHGDITIDKNPQAQAIRTHSKALLFKQLKKDASWLRPGLADYILVFRKPGESLIPIHPDISNNEWIQWARPVWYDIRESNTLNVLEARTDKDEKHIAPLQLSVIERCIRLWSNPGELVLSPFMGIGSEGYTAVLQSRRFLGIELKPEYYRIAVANLKDAVRQKTQQRLI